MATNRLTSGKGKGFSRTPSTTLNITVLAAIPRANVNKATSVKPGMQIIERVFGLLGMDAEEAAARFGHLLDALRYGAPPHGGIALGLDRILTLALGYDSIRDVIAFPKTQSAQEPMVQSPDLVDDHQLAELHIAVLPQEE